MSLLQKSILHRNLYLPIKVNNNLLIAELAVFNV